MIVNKIEDIEIGYTQAFRYMPLTFGSYSSNKIVELLKNGIIDKDDVTIARYLYKFKCAPLEYILRDNPELDERKISRKIMSLVQNRIFNAFNLVSNNEGFSTSGLVFYTLDYGAILLLRSLIEDENLENWKATDLFMSGLKVKKTLLLIDFYNNLEKCDYFNPYVLYNSYGAKLRTKAVFKQDDEIYLTEVVCSGDLLEGSETEMVEKLFHYEQLLSTDGWTWYFEKEPTLLIVADSDKAKEIIKKRMEGWKITKVKYVVLKPKIKN